MTAEDIAAAAPGTSPTVGWERHMGHLAMAEVRYLPSTKDYKKFDRRCDDDLEMASESILGVTSVQDWVFGLVPTG
jgi:hypothetical protein